MKLEAKNLLDALSEKEINYKLFEHEAFFTGKHPEVSQKLQLHLFLNMVQCYRQLRMISTENL